MIRYDTIECGAVRYRMWHCLTQRAGIAYELRAPRAILCASSTILQLFPYKTDESRWYDYVQGRMPKSLSGDPKGLRLLSSTIHNSRPSSLGLAAGQSYNAYCFIQTLKFYSNYKPYTLSDAHFAAYFCSCLVLLLTIHRKVERAKQTTKKI